MSESNQRTIEAYNAHRQKYIDGTPSHVSSDVKVWIDTVLQNVPLKAEVLELGSAAGRDADYIEALGHNVRRTDAAESFVSYLRHSGKQADLLNAITDTIDGPYDLIFANAVLLHFTRSETQSVLVKIHQALNAAGTFAFTLKIGHGESWENHKLDASRFFCFWQPEEIKSELLKVGFKDVQTLPDSNKEAKWFFTIAKK